MFKRKDFKDFSYTERAVIVATHPFNSICFITKHQDGSIVFPRYNYESSFYFPNLFKSLTPDICYIVDRGENLGY